MTRAHGYGSWVVRTIEYLYNQIFLKKIVSVQFSLRLRLTFKPRMISDVINHILNAELM